MTDLESKTNPCNFVNTGRMIGATNSDQRLIPNNVVTICEKDQRATPKRAPLSKKAISTRKVAVTTKNTIPIVFA